MSESIRVGPANTTVPTGGSTAIIRLFNFDGGSALGGSDHGSRLASFASLVRTGEVRVRLIIIG